MAPLLRQLHRAGPFVVHGTELFGTDAHEHDLNAADGHAARVISVTKPVELTSATQPRTETAMSEKFDAAVAALSSNEELRNKVLSATSAEERAGHLRDHGLDLPTQEEINSRHSELADVTGAGSPTKSKLAAAAQAAI